MGASQKETKTHPAGLEIECANSGSLSNWDHINHVFAVFFYYFVLVLWVNSGVFFNIYCNAVYKMIHLGSPCA
jgi:hypothetical protein